MKSTINDLDNMYRLCSIVYKVEYFVLRTLLSFLMLLNTRVVFCFNTKFKL